MIPKDLFPNSIHLKTFHSYELYECPLKAQAVKLANLKTIVSHVIGLCILTMVYDVVCVFSICVAIILCFLWLNTFLWVTSPGNHQSSGGNMVYMMCTHMEEKTCMNVV